MKHFRFRLLTATMNRQLEAHFYFLHTRPFFRGLHPAIYLEMLLFGTNQERKINEPPVTLKRYFACEPPPPSLSDEPLDSPLVTPSGDNERRFVQLSGPSLLDRDLMAVFGAPSAHTPSHHQQQPQQMQRNTSVNSVGNGATAAAGGGAVAGMPRSRSGPATAPSSAGVPHLQPPTRDTPSYNRSAYNSSGTSQQLQQPAVAPGAMVLHGGGGGGQQVAPGAMVMHTGAGGGHGTSVSNGGFNQVRVDSSHQFRTVVPRIFPCCYAVARVCIRDVL